MKTINEAAQEYSIHIHKVPEDWKEIKTTEVLQDFDVKRSFKAGADFAQRWIPVEEELPEKSMSIVSEENYKLTQHVIYKTRNYKYGIACRTEFLDHGFMWSGSGSLQGSITHWRPIELK